MIKLSQSFSQKNVCQKISHMVETVSMLTTELGLEPLPLEPVGNPAQSLGSSLMPNVRQPAGTKQGNVVAKHCLSPNPYLTTICVEPRNARTSANADVRNSFGHYIFTLDHTPKNTSANTLALELRYQHRTYKNATGTRCGKGPQFLERRGQSLALERPWPFHTCNQDRWQHVRC